MEGKCKEIDCQEKSSTLHLSGLDRRGCVYKSKLTRSRLCAEVPIVRNSPDTGLGEITSGRAPGLTSFWQHLLEPDFGTPIGR